MTSLEPRHLDCTYLRQNKCQHGILRTRRACHYNKKTQTTRSTMSVCMYQSCQNHSCGACMNHSPQDPAEQILWSVSKAWFHRQPRKPLDHTEWDQRKYYP